MSEKKHVLIVDDNEDLVKVLLEQLAYLGFTAQGASSVEEGFEKMGEKKPSLILLDILMPKIDGYTFLKEIRDNPDNDDIIVVILSAKGDNVDITKAFNLGANDYLVKPFSGEILAEMMHKLLD